MCKVNKVILIWININVSNRLMSSMESLKFNEMKVTGIRGNQQSCKVVKDGDDEDYDVINREKKYNR